MRKWVSEWKNEVLSNRNSAGESLFWPTKTSLGLSSLLLQPQSTHWTRDCILGLHPSISQHPESGAHPSQSLLWLLSCYYESKAVPISKPLLPSTTSTTYSSDAQPHVPPLGLGWDGPGSLQPSAGLAHRPPPQQGSQILASQTTCPW